MPVNVALPDSLLSTSGNREITTQHGKNQSYTNNGKCFSDKWKQSKYLSTVALDIINNQHINIIFDLCFAHQLNILQNFAHHVQLNNILNKCFPISIPMIFCIII